MTIAQAPLSIKTEADQIQAPPLSLSRMAWLRFRRHKMAMFGSIVLIFMLIYSFGGAIIFSEEYANDVDTGINLEGPSLKHPFGTDTVGRDILARTVYGGQISLIIAIAAVILQLFVGVLVGALAGYYGGIVDGFLMSLTEAVLIVPTLFLLLVMAKYFGGKIPDIDLLGRTFSGSVVVIIIIIGLTSWPRPARIVRAEFLSLKENEFVLAAHATGTPTWQIIFLHILPNSIAPIVVAATLGVANAIVQEAYISFLGLGVQPPTATWGNMITGAHDHIDKEPWIWFFPGLLILFTVLSINFIGDGLRDALDPRSRPM